MKIRATVKPIPKPEKPKPPAPPPVTVHAVKAKVKGPDYDEWSHWRYGKLTKIDMTVVEGARRKQLGVAEYRVNGKHFPANQVYAFRRDEYICTDNQSCDPQL